MYAVDIETVDPNLKTLGDGSIRKDGRVLCVGVYGDGSHGHVEDVFAPDDPELKDILATQDAKVFHNGVYDLTWLVNGCGLTVNGKIEDTMTREALLDEYASSLSLNECCRRRGVEGKNYEDTVETWYKQEGLKGKAISNLDKVPIQVVAQYCIQDVKATHALWLKQEPHIEANLLQGVNTTEAELYPLLIELKKNGIRIDTKKRDIMIDEFMEQTANLLESITNKYNIENINSPVQLRQFFNDQGIHSSNKTMTGNESFNSDALSDIDHPAADLISKYKVVKKALSTFLLGYFTDRCHNGRIHPTFYPTQRDQGGTITGRFSSADPNAQNIPSDDRTMGPQIRSLLIPEPEHILLALDYKQIEYAVFIHYAIGPGAEQARQAIRDGTDYHSLVMKMMGWDKPDRQAQMGWSEHDARKMTKNLNFGSIYGLGSCGFKTKFRHALRDGATATGKDYDLYTDGLRAEYARLVPFVKPTCKGFEALCKSKGYMRSVGGRIHHRPQRSGDYTITNYICQGGASDILKLGLVKAWKAGVFNVLKAHLTVHDENVVSCPPTKEGVEAAAEFSRCMTSAVTLKVPIRVDEEGGPNWGIQKEQLWHEWRAKYGAR